MIAYKSRAYARCCYEANRACGIAIGEAELPHWEDAPESERAAWAEVTAWLWFYPAANLEELHRYWLDVEKRLGWSYGPRLDNQAKQHPHHCEYDRLPSVQKTKLAMHRSIVRIMREEHESCTRSATTATEPRLTKP